MTAPSLAVMRRGEHLIDPLFPGIRGWIVEESIDFLGWRQQTDHVEVQTSKQGAAVGLGRAFQPLFVERLLDECVDRIHSRYGRNVANWRAECPPVARWFCACACFGNRSIPNRAGID